MNTSKLYLNHANIRVFASLLRSGVAGQDALSYILPRLRTSEQVIAQEIISDLSSGKNFSTIFSRTSLNSDPLYVFLIESAESSGSVPDALEIIAAISQEKKNKKSHLITLLLYPAIVILLAIAVMLLILMFIVPNITPIIQMNHSDLPGVTKLLIYLSQLIRNHPLMLLLTMLIITVGIWGSFRLQYTRSLVEKLLLRIPIINTMITSYVMSMYTLALHHYTLHSSDLAHIFARVSNGVSITYYRDKFKRISELVDEGNNLSTSFQSVLIDPIWTLFAKVAEQTSSYSNMFANLETHYKHQFESMFKVIMKLIEPILMFTIGIMVGLLAYGILSPIYGLISSFK